MKKYKGKRIIAALGISALLGGALAGCGNHTNKTASPSNKSIQIVAAEDFYGEVAKAVLGNHGTVTSIINKPSMDPHDFEATTGTAKTVNKADIVIYNGIGYDGWMKKLTQSSKNDDQKVIAVGEDVMNKQEGDNEHLWYNPTTVPKLADKIADELSALDSKHKKDYEANAAAYKKDIQAIQDEINKLKKNSNGAKVNVSEPVFDYALQAMGYKEGNEHFSKAVEDGNDPSPSDIAQMQEDVKKHRIAFFVDNIQATDSTVKNIVNLCKKYNVPVVKVTETLPTGKDYKTWMLDQYKQVENIQSSQK
ncbi:zinc ABC transporter solute-binding protein [Bacillus ginsengihumi]|uniref:Zinc ABC transporter solute-binding protein n=1 Tax=Heyndrickxia ginsengihumi TaxID=363870 RepID=A0A6M0P2V6_9BACI|nr:metal ABC transporter solute-binding protein [Heyndrickxia ginsengihumi]NEY19024.1 zinc ABC transporter solute-binding protein [Heyndrickxia ginsengihumi]